MGRSGFGGLRLSVVDSEFYLASHDFANETLAQCDLTFAKICENRFDIEIEFRRERFARPMNFRDDGIFGHVVNSP